VIAAVTSPAVTALDTTGAGDTFSAALTIAMVEGQGHSAALKFACTAGAAAVIKAGAQPSLPFREEVEKLLLETE
jgi:ribokinase